MPRSYSSRTMTRRQRGGRQAPPKAAPARPAPTIPNPMQQQAAAPQSVPGFSQLLQQLLGSMGGTAGGMQGVGTMLANPGMLQQLASLIQVLGGQNAPGNAQEAVGGNVFMPPQGDGGVQGRVDQPTPFYTGTIPSWPSRPQFPLGNNYGRGVFMGGPGPQPDPYNPRPRPSPYPPGVPPGVGYTAKPYQDLGYLGVPPSYGSYRQPVTR